MTIQMQFGYDCLTNDGGDEMNDQSLGGGITRVTRFASTHLFQLVLEIVDIQSKRHLKLCLVGYDDIGRLASRVTIF